jgi:hypothetical protein
MVSNTGRGTASGMTIAVLILHSQWKIRTHPPGLGCQSRVQTRIATAANKCRCVHVFGFLGEEHDPARMDLETWAS